MSTRKRKDAKNGQKVRNETMENDADDSSELHDVPASDIRRKPTTWFMQNRVECGTVAVFQGEKQAGKSTWLRALAASVTTGKPFPGSKARNKIVGGVLWYAGEESKEVRVIPGLDAAGADLSKVYVSDCMGDDTDRQLQLPNDCERLARRIEYRKAKLVVIDPVFSFTDGTCDLEGPTAPARRFMKEVQKVANKTGAIIILSRNLTKDTSRGALASGRGCLEIANQARAVLHVQKVPGLTKEYALAVAACNAGKEVSSITYRIVDKGGCGVIEATGTSSITADELAGGEDADLDRTMLERAKELIRSLIPNGKLDSKIIKAKAESAMISVRTLLQAAKDLKLRYDRVGTKENTVSYWLPPTKGWGP